jgi:hydrogenase maturation protein HypF
VNARVDVRKRIRIRGVVQGVGMRPFVYRQAVELGLSGTIRNDADGVAIDVQGGALPVDALIDRLRAAPPPLARIDSIEVVDGAPDGQSRGFRILHSRRGRIVTALGADTAICPECLAELFDPTDRRYRHPFINCTNCGPRFTVTRSLPYDRPNTSMAQFPLCDPCMAEYTQPGARRFHAEATCCARCGPRLWFESATQAPPGDPIAAVYSALHAGTVVAIKGLGGFHLACDARNAAALRRLRARKQRDQQPFALMVANLASTRSIARVEPADAALLTDPARPIVLLDHDRSSPELSAVADGLPSLGIMLPYTPIHYLLFHEASGRPRDATWLERVLPDALVMTSANIHGEPLIKDNDEARERLAGLADGWLMHDRDIVVRCDDSVIRTHGGRPRYVRRSRGVVPAAVRLSRASPPVLALGGHYKSTVCLTRGDQAFLSQHLGDLDSPASRHALDEAVEHLERLLDIRPCVVAHDLHPDYYSTALALRISERMGVPTLAVQHHHAHLAAVLAEWRVEEPVIGLALDGSGYGGDGTIWGGELLRVDGCRCERVGHLRELELAGGEAAAREPWRVAAAVLHQLGRGAEIESRFSVHRAARTVAAMLGRQVGTVRTTSLGRWFDAAAALLGVCHCNSYEGHAAMLLEGCAMDAQPVSDVPTLSVSDTGVLDVLPLLERMINRDDCARAAREFHVGLARGLAQWVRWGVERSGVTNVALAGGCFLNSLLTVQLRSELAGDNIKIFEAACVPPNDGAISLGQCWVAQRAANTAVSG